MRWTFYRLLIFNRVVYSIRTISGDARLLIYRHEILWLILIVFILRLFIKQVTGKKYISIHNGWVSNSRASLPDWIKPMFHLSKIGDAWHVPRRDGVGGSWSSNQNCSVRLVNTQNKQCSQQRLCGNDDRKVRSSVSLTLSAGLSNLWQHCGCLRRAKRVHQLGLQSCVRCNKG